MHDSSALVPPMAHRRDLFLYHGGHARCAGTVFFAKHRENLHGSHGAHRARAGHAGRRPVEHSSDDHLDSQPSTALPGTPRNPTLLKRSKLTADDKMQLRSMLWHIQINTFASRVMLLDRDGNIKVDSLTLTPHVEDKGEARDNPGQAPAAGERRIRTRCTTNHPAEQQRARADRLTPITGRSPRRCSKYCMARTKGRISVIPKRGRNTVHRRAGDVTNSHPGRNRTTTTGGCRQRTTSPRHADPPISSPFWCWRRRPPKWISP